MVDKPEEPASSDSAGPPLPPFAIDRQAEVPVGVQLGWTLCSLISDGSFKPGERLPTLREMAQASGLNVNTIRAVYQRLEQRGLIESQQGSGTFVARTSARGTAVGTIAATAARAARETGVNPRAVAAALYVAPEPPALSGDEAADLSQVGQRQLLRRQIAAFESALAEIEAANPGVAPAAKPAGAGVGVGPALLGTDELKQVRTALVRRLAVVQAAIDARDQADADEAPRARSRKDAAQPAAAAADANDKAPKRARRPRATSRTLPAGT
jgi:DNA-binding transcriptional regulator YhcF (GntR family)